MTSMWLQTDMNVFAIVASCSHSEDLINIFFVTIPAFLIHSPSTGCNESDESGDISESEKIASI